MVPVQTITTPLLLVQVPTVSLKGGDDGQTHRPNPLITRDVTIQYVCIRYALLPGIIKQPTAVTRKHPEGKH